MEDKSIEDILSELQPQAKSSGVNKLMEELADKKRSVVHPEEGEIIPRQSSPKELDRILAEISPTPVKNNGKIAQENREIHSEELKTIEEELVKQKSERAKAWLKDLDPLSSEGLWFKEFVRHYPSELEAALAYLQ